jgi:hypothetical protein
LQHKNWPNASNTFQLFTGAGAELVGIGPQIDFVGLEKSLDTSTGLGIKMGSAAGATALLMASSSSLKKLSVVIVNASKSHSK